MVWRLERCQAGPERQRLRTDEAEIPGATGGSELRGVFRNSTVLPFEAVTLYGTCFFLRLVFHAHITNETFRDNNGGMT